MEKMYRAKNNERLKMVDCSGCYMMNDDGCWYCEQDMFIDMVNHLERTLEAVDGVHSEFLDDVTALVLKYGDSLKQQQGITYGVVEGIEGLGNPMLEVIERIRELSQVTND